MSRRGAPDPKFPFLLLQGRGVFGVPLVSPWGEHAASESEAAVGLGTLRPPHCSRRVGDSQQRSVSPQHMQQILPARWAVSAQLTPSTATRSQIRWPCHSSRFRACWRAPPGSTNPSGGSLKSPSRQSPPCAWRLRAGEEPARRGLASWGRRGPQLSLQLVGTKFSSKPNKPLFLPQPISFRCLCQDCKNLKRFPQL